ncbi:unnamed protein product [Rhizopus stolonifer]
MARKGCTIILACRTEAKAKVVVEEIKAATNNEKVDFIRLDLLSLESVKEFAKEFKSRYQNLNILINNAGIMMCPFELSKDGIESQFATNHVAHHYLTMLLLPLLEKSTPSRVVTVSSIGQKFHFGGLDLESISDPQKYSKGSQYTKTKVCNILFTKELSRRMERKGISNFYANCNHPGSVSSDLFRHVYNSEGVIMGWLHRLLFISTEDGALTQLYLATSPEVEEKDVKGQYYVPIAVPSQPKAIAMSEETALELWNFTEKLIKEKVPDYKGAPI